MEPTVRLVKGGAGLLLLSALVSVALWAQELSHARIVRLSFTEGVVSVQRPDVDEWAEAPTNTPIQEGFKIATAERAFAEVEFENASTARIGQQSLLEFTQLALLPSGGKVNRMNLRQGYATFNVMPEGEDIYEVTAGTATFTPRGKTRFRVDFEGGILQAKVFKGSVEIMSPEGTGTLGKDTVLEIRPGSDEPFQISQGITKDAWDEWVEERESRIELVRHRGRPKLYSNNLSELLWGSMDLMYYGTWVSVPGYGSGWVPNVGWGWSPYTIGQWCWYPSLGYTWISHEPWGWLPYHYGAWIYEPTIGWCWIPTGGFGSWSPGLVNWYQGPGWVGWAPMSPMLGGSAYNCPRSEGCIAVVPEGTLRGGGSIRPDGVRWTHSDSGRRVDTLDIRPERSAMLPGSAHTGMGRFWGASDSHIERRFGRGQTPTSVPGEPRSTGGTVNAPVRSDSSVVFDPETKRYVNNPSVPSIPATPPTPASTPSPSGGPGMSSRGGGISQGARLGPQANYPMPVAQGRGADADRTGMSGATAPRGEWGRGTTDQGRGSARGIWSPSADPGRSSASGGRSASAGGSRSDSGARSSAGSSSSSGGRSSGVSSGGWGGGSSSGGHTSGGRSSGGWSGGHSTGGWGGGGGSPVGAGGGGSRGPAGGGGGSRGPR